MKQKRKRDTGARAIISHQGRPKRNVAMKGGVTQQQLTKDFLESYNRTGVSVYAMHEVMEKYGKKVDYNIMKTVVGKVKEYLHDMAENSYKELFLNHAFIYNKIWRFFKEAKVPIGQNKALMHKERLFGFHADDNQNIFEVNNEIELITGTGYDFEKLNDQEKERLEQLLLKCKPTKKLAL